MSNDAGHQETNKNNNRWLRMGKKILISALIAWAIHSILLALGWETWEKFSKKADAFAERVIVEANRLTPFALYRALTTGDGPLIRVYDSNNIDHSLSSQSTFTYRQLTFKEKIVDWLDNFWYTDQGKSFWVGRVLLLLTIAGGISLTGDDYRASRNKTTALLLFPVRFVWNIIIFLLGLSIMVLFAYFLIKVLLAIVGGLVTLFTGFLTAGGFLKILVEEARGEVGGEAKKSLGGYLLPFVPKKKQTNTGHSAPVNK